MLDEVLAFVREVGLHQHIILFYYDLGEKHQILFTYLLVGIERGEQAIYIASEETPRQIREAMTEFGLNVKGLEDSSALQIRNYDEVYLFDGKPDIPRTLTFLDEAAREANARGFKRVSVASEMACWFEYGYVDELVEYEKTLQPRFTTPLSAICAYNADILESETVSRQVLDLIAAHAHSINSRSKPAITEIHGTGQRAPSQNLPGIQTTGVRSRRGTPLETVMSKP